MNEKSLENLKPFTGKNDPRRQNGRKKGQLNRATTIRNILSQEIDPGMLFSPASREKLEGMRGKTYLEALTFVLLNQALGGETKAANVLYRELKDTDKDYPHMLEWQREPLEITVVESSEQLEKLKRLEELEKKWGEYDE